MFNISGFSNTYLRACGPRALYNGEGSIEGNTSRKKSLCKQVLSQKDVILALTIWLLEDSFKRANVQTTTLFPLFYTCPSCKST